MRVSEKSLELNIGAEVLWLMRNAWGMPKTYLRGLTQVEEKQEGVDFFAQLNPSTRIFAFQFKAPKGRVDLAPYKYTLVREQHDLLFQLSQQSPGGVFYVLPYYVTVNKLQNDVPNLMQDTWLLDIGQMPPTQTFNGVRTRVVRCTGASASVNPAYKLQKLHDAYLPRESAIPVQAFASWYGRFRVLRAVLQRRGNPWLVRGLRLAIVS